jgi:hypothetical protein
MLIPTSPLMVRVLTIHLTCTQTITFQITSVPKGIWAKKPSTKMATLSDSEGSSFKTKVLAHRLRASTKATPLSTQPQLVEASNVINLWIIENKTTAEYWATERQSDTIRMEWISTRQTTGSHTGCTMDKHYLQKTSRILRKCFIILVIKNTDFQIYLLVLLVSYFI